MVVNSEWENLPQLHGSISSPALEKAMRSPAPENNHNSDQIGLLQLPAECRKETLASPKTRTEPIQRNELWL